MTALAFSDGGDVLLSGGEDTLVHAWLLLDVLDASADANAPPASFQSWCAIMGFAEVKICLR